MAYNPEKPYKNQILELIKETWNTPYVSVKPGTYALFKRNFNCLEVDHTDGIGTKGMYHWKARSFKNAVQDALAMNLNDLAIVGARPYKLQCHLILPKDDSQAILEIMRNLVKECKKYNIAITGGETSIQNNMKGMDISLTVSGFIKKEKKNQFIKGDVLLGLESNGLHSNGFTLARKVLSGKFLPEFIKPTSIYLDTVLALHEKYNIGGMMHITGGAYTKLKSLLKSTDVIIDFNTLKTQSIFKELYKKGVSDENMYRTFNCGIGFIFSVSQKDYLKVISKIKDAHIIGKVVSGNGAVKINSMFSKKRVIFLKNEI